eukprot:COSAG05_NODE_1322_length_5190_cov_6.444507_5_plen_71_part_00
MGALALGAYVGAGNQGKLEAMANARILDEVEFRKHNPVYYKDEHGHFVETSGIVKRTFAGYAYATGGGHH